jgi:hypothetical protein
LFNSFTNDPEDLFADITPKEEVIKLSYSRISDYSRNGVKALIDREKVDNQGAKIGSIVDDLLFATEDEFKDKYMYFDGDKPTATRLKLANLLLKEYDENPSKDELLEICKTNNFWKGSKDETVLAKFSDDEFWGYINSMRESKTKLVITNQDKDVSQRLVDVLRTHKHSKDIFNFDGTSVYQYYFAIDYRGTLLRGYIDITLVDHDKKTVKFIDLKTGTPKYNEFLESFSRKWRYDLQSVVYKLAFAKFCKEYDLKGYTLENFEFLYISRTERIPFIYEVPKEWIDAATQGYTNKWGYKIKGLHQLIDDIKWHYNNNVFEDKAIYESNGRLILETNIIDQINDEESNNS